MLSAKLSIIHPLVHVYQILVEHHQVVDQNVSVTANVLVIWLALTTNAKIHVLERVA